MRHKYRTDKLPRNRVRKVTEKFIYVNDLSCSKTILFEPINFFTLNLNKVLSNEAKLYLVFKFLSMLTVLHVWKYKKK